MPTIADLLLARAEDDRPGLAFEDSSWSWREVVAACARRAQALRALRRDGPFHVGVLLDNVPEYVFLLGGAALCGATVVGINSTRRGGELVRDIRHADCQMLFSEPRHAPLLEGLELSVAADRRLDIESAAWQAQVAAQPATLPRAAIDPAAPYLLLFTSGTTGDPKAAICSQGRLATISQILTQMRGIRADDVAYLVMPLFHSNALMAGLGPALAAGARIVLRRRFSASGFLPDVRRYGVTYMNYVGKPLSYILATPERPDDADNPLRVAFGNEGAEHDLERFAKRFGCQVVDAYGSTEGGIAVQRSPDMPRGALGMGLPGTVVLDPDTGAECPRARFDAQGRLANADLAVGELANTQTAASFEGYWNNDEANRERTHGGIYWSGDLAYRDEQGFLYFAGRRDDWMRVDGENFAAAPVERILARHPDVALAAVYAVPCEVVGDDAMAALVLRPGARFDPEEFARFLAAQRDLGTKCAPRYVRISDALPMTPTNKILKRSLRRERWECADPVWLRGAHGRYLRLDDAGRDRLRAAFAARGRESALA
ncbi:MAG TPA: AMP-binding protein [Myxococcota bacterium]|nr:AMP-binding protein [Myxococcota bacterium]